MRHLHSPSDRPLRTGSLFSGYGGLDLAVEHVFGAKTVWFSEINSPVAGVFAHHWPDAPNLGDITAIDWSTVPPVDILCGGFPCQDVSTVGKRAGLAPGTRSGLWSHMAEAIDVLRPEWVVIENVRGLLSAPAIRPTTNGIPNVRCNPSPATPEQSAAATLRCLEPDPWNLGDQSTRPLRALGAVLGDLADLRMDARWVGLPASLIGAPHQRFRIFILAHRKNLVSDPARVGLLQGRRNARTSASEARDDRTVASDHRLGVERSAWVEQTHRRVGEPVAPDRGHLQRWGHYAYAIARWEHITGRPAPSPALMDNESGPRPAPEFVEWLMGLPTGWVTADERNLTSNQQITALGNGVLPSQAAYALHAMMMR